MDSFSNFVEIQKLKKELSAKSGNLVRYVITHTASTEGQTLFPIDLSTFNFRTDSVLVQSGRTLLSPTLDYVVQSHSIVLNEGVPLGRTIDIYVYKNVENLDTEKVIDGLQLGVGTVPLDRLAELPVPMSAGGTGATTAEGALDNLLDGNVKIKGSNYSCVVVLNESSGRRQGFQVANNDIYLWNQKDTSNLTSLYLYGEDDSEYLTLRVKKNDVDNYYKIFGEHNTELLSTHIQNLLTGGEISMVKGIQTIVIDDVKPTATDANFYDMNYLDYTISAVNVNKTEVHTEGYADYGDTQNYWGGRVARLINSTTVRVYANHRATQSLDTATGIRGVVVTITEYY